LNCLYDKRIIKLIVRFFAYL